MSHAQNSAKLLVVAAFVIVLGGCASAPAEPAQPAECRPDLSSTGFVQELVFPQGTPRTSLFDDYTPASYHVTKASLLEAVRDRRASKTPEILGLLIGGPHGPLWEYDVVLFIQEGPEVGVHWLSMPHARITWKGAGRIGASAYADIVKRLTVLPDLLLEAPPAPASGSTSTDVEWAYGFLAAFWSPALQVHHSAWSWFEAGNSQDAVEGVLGELEKVLQTTYSTNLPVEEPAYICPP